MSDKRISELASLAEFFNDDVIPIVDSGAQTTKKITYLDLFGIHNVDAYGAVGDGVANDTAAIKSALAASVINNGVVVFSSEKTYRTTSTITEFGNIAIRSSGPSPATIQPSGDFTTFGFASANAAKLSTTVTADMQIKDISVTLASVVGLVIGDLLVFDSDVLWYWDNRGTLTKGEVHTIKSIAGNVVTLSSPVADNYDIGGGEVVTVVVYPQRSLNVQNLRIECQPNIDSTIMTFSFFQNSKLEGVELVNSDTGGLIFSKCFNTVINKAAITLNADITDGLGYGIQDNGSAYTRVTDSTFVDCRRGVDFSGVIPARFGTVSHCIAMNENQLAPGVTSGFGTHGTAEYILFANNIVHGSRYGIISRGGNISIIGNVFAGSGQQCIIASHGNGLYISDNFVGGVFNRVTLSLTQAWLLWGEFLRIGADFDADGEITVVNNNAFRIKNNFIATEQKDIVWRIKDNNVSLQQNGAGFDTFFLAGEADLINSQIFGNTYRVIVGVRNWYDAVTVNFQATEMQSPIDIAGYYIQGTERADPAAPAANTGIMYFRDNGGKTQLVARFPTGAIQPIATEP